MKTRMNTLIVTGLSALILSITFQPANAQSCTPLGDQVSYGTGNVWIGYVYQGANFNQYKGYVNEGSASSPNFDESFGGNTVNYNTQGCSILTDTFSVRYKLSSNFSSGDYEITVGGDDGYRLSLDGGATWVINNWSDHSYTTSTYTVHLNGSYNLVLEYYEKYINNRVSFQIAPTCLGTGNPAVYGTGNTWQGYLYQGMNFNTYKGYITEGSTGNPNFDESFGGSNTSFSTNSCSIITEKFSARFRLQSTLVAGTVLTVGGDDGYRLSLDGGSTWVINKWKDQSYNVSSYTVPTSGLFNMVLEYYENGGANRISFNLTAPASLPVQLSNWNGRKLSGSGYLLLWSTASEINFDHFDLQRSVDGRHFSSLATLSARGNSSSQPVNYQYTDLTAPSGTVYYRLAMFDKDNSIRYSSILAFENGAAALLLRVFPTVVENQQVNIESSISIPEVRIDLYDWNGRLASSQIRSISAGRNSISWQSNLASGTYILRISGNSGILGKQVLLIH